MISFQWNGALVISFFILIAVGCDKERSDNRPTFEISVSEPLARSCDVLFEDMAVKVDDVNFSDRVTGSFQYRSPRLAVSFFNNENTAFNGYQARIHLTSKEDVSDDQVMKMVSTTCFDPEGNVLEKSDIEIVSR